MGGGGSKARQDGTMRALAKDAIRGATEDSEGKVLDTFKAWDKDGNGQISLEELGEVIRSLNGSVNKGDLKVLFNAADTDGSGSISLSEMVNFFFSTPFLKDFFRVQTEILREGLKKLEGADLTNPDAVIADIQKHIDSRCKADLQPLIEKAFAHHDKDGSGVLEPDEAAILFASYAEQLAANVETAQELYDCLYFETSNSGTSAASLSLQERIDQANLRTETVARMKKNVKAAFSVVDVSGDAKLQKGELVAAFSPGTPQNAKLMEAFGFNVDHVALKGQVEELSKLRDQLAAAPPPQGFSVLESGLGQVS